MAIVKNKKTGKYEIVKSPDSFYESPSKIKPGQAVYANIDDINKPSGTVYTSDGSGGYTPAGTLSKGGLSSGGYSSNIQSQQQSSIIAQQEAIARAKELAKQQAESRRLAQEQARIQAGTQAQQQIINVSVGGRVTIGNRSYVGEAYVPEVGMTANKYSRVLREEAIAKGEISKKDFGRVRFSGIKTGKETLSTGETVVYNNRGEVVGIEADLGMGRQSFAIESYKKEVKRLQEVQPQTAILDAKTGRLSSGTGTKVNIGELEFTPRNEVQVYTEPKTGKPIKDIQQYMIEKDIPISIANTNKLSNQEFIDMATGKTKIQQPIYDIKGIPKDKFVIEEKRFTRKMSPFYYENFPEGGGVMPITATDLTNLASGGIALAKLPLASALGFITSPVTSRAYSYLDERLLPQPQTFGGKLTKGIAEGAIFAKYLGTGKTGQVVTGMFAGSISSSAMKDPLGTLKSLASPETLGFVLGGSLSSKPFSIVKDLRRVEDPVFFERQYKKIVNGKEVNLGEFIIKGERSPPRLKIDYNVLGFPKDFKFIESKGYGVVTLEPVVQGRLFRVIEFKEGSNVINIRKIKGETEPFNIKNDLSKLSNTEFYALQRYVQRLNQQKGFKYSIDMDRTLSTDKAVKKLFERKEIFEPKESPLLSRSTISKLFSESSDFSKSFIGSQKTIQINTKTLMARQVPYGRRTNLDVSISRTEPLFETEAIKAVTTENLFKDVSKPFARASGKTPRLTGETYFLKEPINLQGSEGVNFINPAEITKTPFSKTFQEVKQIQKQEPMIKEISKALPVIKSPKLEFADIKPQYSSESRFAGLGIYEQTTGGRTPLIIENRKIQDNINFNITSLGISNELKISNRLVTIELLKNKNRTKQVPILKQEPILIQEPILKEDLILKNIQKQKQLQKQKLTLKQIEKIKVIPSIINPARTRFDKRIKLSDDAFRTSGRGIKKVETYSVFIKRRGKFQTIGGDLGYGQALKLGELRTKQTLGRTFKVRKTGFKEVGIDESFSEPDLGVFRKFKIRGGQKLDLPTGTFIQKTQFSLSGAGEKREIQMARQEARQLNNLINM